MKQICRITGQPFKISDEDLKFYEKMGVPPPTLCPEERQRRRMSWENIRHLYHRKCSATGKKIVSLYSAETPFPVYEQNYWWSDAWDAKKYGQEFDFSKSFFDQFQQLFNRVPKMSLLVDENENSYYVNQSGWNKNCYLCFCTDHCQDCSYCQDVYYSKDVYDSLLTYNSELCYKSLVSRSCYRCFYIQNCENCSDSWYLKNCVGCHHCFGCINIRNKRYCFNNVQLSKEEYFQKIESLSLDKNSFTLPVQVRFSEFSQTLPHKEMEGSSNENVTGNIVSSSRNTRECYESKDLENCAFCENVRGAKDCMDMYRWGNFSELCYECCGVGENAYQVLFCDKSWGSTSHLTYCDECIHCKHLFGCIGLRNAQYCILNKQYTKEEYFQLREKIIDHMKESGEWGEFFPIELSPFAYNETVAQEYFPLTKEEALARGYKWKDEEPGVKYDGPPVAIPNTIADTPDSICDEILTCETCTKNYRIVKPELQFYRKMNLPVPHSCPNCRHKARMALRNPRKLWKRTCDKCNADIETTFAPDRPERVYCERCYLEEVQ